MDGSKDRLKRVVEAAAEGRIGHPELARELSDILLEWPPENDRETRRPFEMLLTKTLDQIDGETGEAIRVRPFPQSGVPGAGAVRGNTREGAEFDEELLIKRARGGSAGFVSAFADALHVSPEISVDILRDVSGQLLAIALKGARARQATFSALAVLAFRSRSRENIIKRLAMYESMPQDEAERRLAAWQRTSQSGSFAG